MNEKFIKSSFLESSNLHYRALLGIPLFCLFLCAAVWLIVFSRLDTQKKILEENALKESALLANAYADYVSRSIDHLDALTRNIKYFWEKGERRSINLEKLGQAKIFDTVRAGAISIFDRNGNVVTTTISGAKSFSITDRAYFAFHRDHAADDMHVSPPLTGKAIGKQIMVFSRRLNAIDGSFDGVLVVALHPDSFFLPTSELNSNRGTFLAFYMREENLAIVRGAKSISQISGASLRTAVTSEHPVLMRDLAWHESDAPYYVAAASLQAGEYSAIVGLSRSAVMAPLESRRSAYQTVAWIVTVLLMIAALLSVHFSRRRFRHMRWMRQIQTTYRLATEGANECFYMWQAIRDHGGTLVDCRIVDCNDRGANLFGTSKSAFLKTTLSEWVKDSERFKKVKAILQQAIEWGFAEDDYEVLVAGVVKAKWLRYRVVSFDDALAVTLRDISKEKEHERELTRLVNEDTLTGLPNRHWLTLHLPEIVRNAEQSGKDVAVLFLGLDGFKNINDTLGHSTGNQILKTVGSRMKALAGTSGTAVRAGGDEFLLIFDSVLANEKAVEVAAKILQELAQPYPGLDNMKPVGASVGIALYPESAEDAESLLRNAHIAMSTAKTERRGGFRLYDQTLFERIKKRIDMEHELARAVDGKHFAVHYQPRVDAISGELVSMEALVRWPHPERGMISPNEFIPLAEATGLILKIGPQIMDAVCAQITAWQAEGLPVVPVSVNVSARQFDEGKVAELVAACLATHNVAAHFIELELTESAMMGDFESVQAQIDAINQLGVRIHIDDFGTGYSSLSLLHRLHLDVLKVDRAFTAQLGRGESGEAFFAAIVSMAKALGMRIVAEGVETHEQLRVLRKLGCDEIQGYLVSRPLPSDQIERLMQKRTLIDAVGKTELLTSLLKGLSFGNPSNRA